MVNPSDWFNKSEEISVARNELKITLQNYEILFFQVFLLRNVRVKFDTISSVQY